MKKIDKPWGSEEILHADSRYVLKRINVKKGYRLSLQYHEYKTETLYLIEGTAIMDVSKDKITPGSKLDISNIPFIPKQYITIEPRTVHRIKALTNCVFLEASTPELWDVVRIEDDYGRG